MTCFWSGLGVLVVLVLAAGCSDGSEGTGGAGTASGGGGTDTGGSAGTGGSGGTGASGGVGGTDTGGSGGTDTGGSAGTGGSGDPGSAGTGADGGTGGDSTGGASTAGSPGTGGSAGSGGGDLSEVAAALDGFRWEMPCEAPGDPQVCTSTVLVDETVTLGGDAGTTYLVTLRFRGVVEPMTYSGGALDGEYFRIGGTPSNPDYNIYSVTVSDPAEVYYLNDAAAVGHDVFIIEYEKTIPMAGGATVSLLGDGQNDAMIANFENLTVDGVPPAPDVYDGQHIQIDVVSVEVAP